MSRLRMIFEKRDFACFVRHVELPQLFGRIARRAGLKVALTQGMSPHPHIVMGPALPVGVISLCEAAEIWFDENVPPEEALEKMNAQAPTGFRFLRAARIAPDAMSLNKCFDAASYWLCPRDMDKLAAVKSVLSEKFGAETLLALRECGDGLELVMHDPSQTGPGALVKALIAREAISGWPEVCIARLRLGRWRADKGEIAPLL